MLANYSPKKAARLAGLLYVVGAVFGFYALKFVPSRIIVKDDSAATFENLLSHEFLFRTGIASQIVSNVIFILLTLILYQLFRSVNEFMSRTILALVLVNAPFVFFGEALHLIALSVANGELMKSLNDAGRQDFVMLLLRIYEYGIIVTESLWGCFFILFGLLVYNSGFMPRILGVLLALGGTAYITDSFTFIFRPEYISSVTRVTGIFYGVGEISTMFWLLIKGVKTKPATA